MNDRQRCRAVAEHIVNSMSYQDLWQYVMNCVYDEVANSGMLKDYMEEYGLTEEQLKSQEVDHVSQDD